MKPPPFTLKTAEGKRQIGHMVIFAISFVSQTSLDHRWRQNVIRNKSRVQYCDTAILQYCDTATLRYYNTAILRYYNTAILRYCDTAILRYCNTAQVVFNTAKIAFIFTSLSAVLICDFHIFIFVYLPLYGFIWYQLIDQLSVGLSAQMVEHCTGIEKVMGSNPVQAWIFFRP